MIKNRPQGIIEKFLSGLEKGRKRVWLAKGGAEMALVLFASIGIVSLLAHAYSNAVYFSILKIFALGALCAGFIRFMLPAILRKEGKATLALELDKIVPGLGEDTLNAVLLAADLTRGQSGLGVSETLAEAHIGGVAGKLGSLDPSPAVPKEKANRYIKPLAAVLILSLALFIFSPRDFRSFLFSSNLLPAGELELLQLADIKLEYKYPAYTRLASQVVEGSAGDVKALKGTLVIFRATPVNEMYGGRLVVENGSELPVSYLNGEMRAEFPVLSDGGFFVKDNRGKHRSKTFKIISLKDENPKVVIESPFRDLIETKDEESLDISYETSDDFGLSRLILSWKTRSGESTKQISQFREELKSEEGIFTWSLSEVEAEPDEIIEVRILVYDNDTVSGPKVGVSNSIKVRLNNPKNKHRDSMALAEKLLEELLDALGDEIEKGKIGADSNGSRSRSAGLGENSLIIRTREIQGVITGKIEKVLQTLDSLIDRMKDDEYSDYTHFVGLSNMEIRVGDLLSERRSMISSLTMSDLSRLESLITREINELEDDALFLDSMIKGEKMRESLLYGRGTLDKYKELSELLQELKQGGKSDETRKEIEKKIEELSGLMNKLAENLASMNRDSYEGFLNPDAFDAVDMGGQLNEVMRLIDQGKIAEALDLLARLSDGLENMIASLETGFQSFSSSSISEEMAKLDQVISRIKSVEESEKSLRTKTEALKQSILSGKAKQENPADFSRRLRKKVEELKSALMEIKAKALLNAQEGETLEASFLIERLLTITQEMDNWLQAYEFKEALERAKNVEGGTESLKEIVETEDGRMEKAKPEVGRSRRLAAEIRKDLERVREGGTGKEKPHELAKGQDEIEKEASGLTDDLRGLEEDLMLSPQIGDNLAESQGFMHGASRNLRTKEISKAISNQEEAIKSLEKARAEAEGLLDKYRMSAKGMGFSVPFVLGRDRRQQGYRGIDTSHVEIPSSEESSLGKEFKESLLKALKDGSPEDYIELNKRYYERVIK